MDKREQSREQWEQEIREMQQNITPAEAPWAAHYIAKKSSAAPIPDLAHLVRLVLGGILLALGINTFSFHIPHGTIFALVVVAIGGCLGFTGFHWNHKRR